MKAEITVNRRVFLSLLKQGGMFCNKRSTIAILENVRCKTNGNRIRIESSDNDNFIRVYGDLISSSDNVSFCVNGKELANILSLVSDETVSIMIDTEDRKEVVVSHKNGKSTLPCFDDTEYPNAPAVEGENLSLPAAILSRWLSVAVKFTATDVLRPVMNGVLLYSEEGGKTGVAASNGYKLFRSEKTIEGARMFRVIVNPSAALALVNSLGSVTGDVSLIVGENIIMFKTPDFIITSRLIEGKYPNVESVIPKNTPYSLTFSRTAMIAALSRLQLSSNIASGLVRIETDGMFIKATTEDIDFHKSGEENVAFRGDCVKAFGVKGTVLLSTLSVFDDDEAVLRIMGPEYAMTFSRTDADGCYDTFLLMPMMLN